MRIDYNPQIDYGYEVNYLLYNYFLFFQREYDQQLGPFPAPITINKGLSETKAFI